MSTIKRDFVNALESYEFAFENKFKETQYPFKNLFNLSTLQYYFGIFLNNFMKEYDFINKIDNPVVAI